MKVIDVLVKIANKEKIPIFKIGYDEYYVSSDWTIRDKYGKNAEWYIYESWLNEEVEIIEEKPKKIEEINKSYPIFNFDEKSFNAMKDMLQDVYSKQVEVIKAVDYLLEKESDK